MPPDDEHVVTIGHRSRGIAVATTAHTINGSSGMAERGLKGRLKYVARGLSNRLRDFADEEPQGFDLAAVRDADVALYFADAPSKLYQLAQWLPVLEQRTDVRTVIVLRQIETMQALQGRTSLPIVLAPNYDELMALYDRASFRAVVYVNNGWTNFQSLAFQQAVHVHVNHGESDKICMVSNQAKAYDLVFVAGEAAVHRHEAALAMFDASRLVRVGRPQLDLSVAPVLPPHDGPTITYAPTWEGEDEANNYSSLDVHGIAIIEASLAQPGARVVYKPHPRIPISTTPSIRAAHDALVARMRAAGQPVLPKADMLAVIAQTDCFIGDVSSATLDHLYLRPQAPIALADRRSDRAQLLADTPVARGAHVIDAASIATLPSDLAALLAEDPQQVVRAELRDLYFDGLAPGESTTRFWDALQAAMTRHDAAVAELRRVRVSPSTTNPGGPA